MTPVMIVALTIWAEARGESFEGKYGVASTMWNRHRQTGMKLEEVCKQPRQYSCWNGGNIPKVGKDPASQKAWLECLSLASCMIYSPDVFFPAGPWVFYHNPKLVSKVPNQFKNAVNIKHIGNHVFYNGGRT